MAENLDLNKLYLEYQCYCKNYVAEYTASPALGFKEWLDVNYPERNES